MGLLDFIRFIDGDEPESVHDRHAGHLLMLNHAADRVRFDEILLGYVRR
jgi:hypothetical protein